MPSKKSRRRPKYNAKKVKTPYGIFDSQKEYRRYLQLKGMQDMGIISDLELQPSFLLIDKQYDHLGKLLERAVRYVADFSYHDNEGHYVVEDAKGYRTPEYIIKRKLMLDRHGIRVKEV